MGGGVGFVGTLGGKRMVLEETLLRRRLLTQLPMRAKRSPDAPEPPRATPARTGESVSRAQKGIHHHASSVC